MAAIVVWRRAEELRRLLSSLQQWKTPPQMVVVVDHAPGWGAREVAESSVLPVQILEDASNPGPGAGWSRAARLALENCPDAEAVWFLDDDVVVEPAAAQRLAEVLEQGADLAAPLLEDAGGRLWAFPEPEDLAARKLIRKAQTPRDALALLGAGPHRLCWCTGACVAVRSAFYRRLGPHRSDFFMLGEDLEFSMRAAALGQAVFVCDAVVFHWPPACSGASAADLLKFCALLQNLAWLAFHSPHSRHLKGYLAGNVRRFGRTYGWHRLPLALRCVWNGAVSGEPAGGPRGQALRAALTSQAR